MDLQYEWLEELIKKSSLPNLEPNCKGGDQMQRGSSKSKSTQADQIPSILTNHSRVEEVCKEHTDLSASFQQAKILETGFTFSLNFEKKGAACGFDCSTLFSAFADADTCVTDEKMQHDGEINTECGKAWYIGYSLS
jgi:hypothetical protein